MASFNQFPPPGYTGHVHGKGDVFARTPVMAQAEAHSPSKVSPLAARGAEPVPVPGRRDPAAEAAAAVATAAGPPMLWPCLQTKGAQEPAKPATSNLQLGDERLNPFVTSYAAQYDAPFAACKKIRSPLRNNALQHVADLKEVYASAFGRVGEKRLNDILDHMRGRLTGKMGNSNQNAFKLRKLFKMYDTEGSGLVEIEDFRVSTEAFGMQLDDDSLFAIYYRFDPQGTGRLDYHRVMRELLDDDTYKQFEGGSDPLQAAQ